MTENSALSIATKQLDWYSTHKKQARWSAHGLELTAVALSLFVAIAGLLRWDPAVPGVAGALLVTLAVLRRYFQWQESWIAWAGAEAELERAIDYYNTNTEPYDRPDRDRLLVQRTWDVRDSETKAWASRKSSPPSATPEEFSGPPGRQAG